jgi:hypothetical protein
MYEHPRFVRSVQLRKACSKIPDPTLHAHIAKLFWPLHCVHHPLHAPERFTTDLNYKWLIYRWSEDAAVAFWDNFDDRAGEQEAAYKNDQQAAKKAGKWKTRHFRLALPLHNLAQACASVPAAAWSTTVPKAAADASVLFSQYMDDVFAKLDLHRLPARPPEPLAPQGAQPSPPPNQRQELARVLALSQVPLVLAGATLSHVLVMIKPILQSQKAPNMRHTDVAHLKPVLALNLPTPDAHFHGLRAVVLLSLLGFGVVSQSTNATGIRVALFTKRPTDQLCHDNLRPARRILTLANDEAIHSKTHQEILQSRKQGQGEIVFPDLNTPVVAESCQRAAEALQQAVAADG